MRRSDFERLVLQALEELPDQFRDALQNIDIQVRWRPTPAELRRAGGRRGAPLCSPPRAVRDPPGGRARRAPVGAPALGWEAIPLAVLYLYCARDPARYHHVFWLALIEQAAAIVANVYHWGAGDFSFESVVIPAGVAAGLGLLVFLHLFQPKEPEREASV